MKSHLAANAAVPEALEREVVRAAGRRSVDLRIAAEIGTSISKADSKA